MDSGLVTVITTVVVTIGSIIVAMIARGRKERPGLVQPLPQDADQQKRDVVALTAAAEGHAHNMPTTVATLAGSQVELIAQMGELWQRLKPLEEYKATAEARFRASRMNAAAWRRRALQFEAWGRTTEEPVPRTPPPWRTAEDEAASADPFGAAEGGAA